MEFSGEDFVESLTGTLDTFPAEHDKPRKGGRPTIPDNCLLGSRNHWRTFFSNCWPDIGWSLSVLRRRRSSTIKDVQKVFESVQAKPYCDLARVFLSGSTRTVTPQKLRLQRIASNKLHYALQDMQRERPELQRALAEAENALKLASDAERAAIQKEVARRRELLKRNEEEYAAKERECAALDEEVRAGTAYLYCAELLDFLRSGRRALAPANLANALAGLPDLRWRQSDARCSKVREDTRVQHPDAVFQLIDRLTRRMGGRLGKASVGFFRAGLLKLPKKDRYPREFLCEQWRDLRLAIEEISEKKLERGFIPYALTSAFLKNVARPKTSVDNVLDAQEKLTPTKNTQNTDRGKKV